MAKSKQWHGHQSWKVNPFWIWKWQKWIPWIKLPLNPYIARLSMSTDKEITLFVIFWYFFGGHFIFFRVWRSKRHISAWQQQFLDSAGSNYPKNTCCQKLTTNVLTLLHSLLFWKGDQTNIVNLVFSSCLTVYWRLAKNLEEIVAKYAIDANQWS